MKMNKWLITGIAAILLSACSNTAEAPETAEITTTATKTTLTTSVTETTTEEPTTTTITTVVPEPTTAPPLTPADYEAYKVNEQGHIMVVMYHGIMDNPPYHRLKEDFIKDMTFMYEHNYRLISMEDYLSGHIDVPAGMTPIVFTFDDGLESTFSLIEEGDGFAVNSETAIGLMEAFYEEHPDFGNDASLYFHATPDNFPGAGTDFDRLTWLLDNGYGLGNHSKNHANFSKIGEAELLEQIGAVEVYLAGVIPDYKINTMTYPFGARPQEHLRHLLIDGSYQGIDFAYDVCFREGPSGQFYPTVHKKFSPLNTPRVRGSEGEVQDLWWFLDYYEENKSLRYISDGDPNTIVVPEAKAENLAEGLEEAFEVIVY